MPKAVRFVREFFDGGKPVAAIVTARGRSLKQMLWMAGRLLRGRR